MSRGVKEFRESEDFLKVKRYLEKKKSEMNDISTIKHLDPQSMFEVSYRKGYLEAIKRMVAFIENDMNFEEDKDATK